LASGLPAQRPSFAPTLYWESGLIQVPAAYVPPLGGDLAMTFVWARGVTGGAGPQGRPVDGNYNFAASTSLWGKAEVGISLFSSDLKNGLFGKLMLWDQTDGAWRRGVAHWLPSVAVGARNVGTQTALDRFTNTDTAGTFSTSPSVYGVMTRTFVLSPGERPDRPKAQLSLTAGKGAGLFSDDGGYADYGNASTGGVFGGVALDLAAGRHSTFSVLVEHDAWGVNAGVRADLVGLRISAQYLVSGRERVTAATVGGGPGGASGTPVRDVGGGGLALSMGWQTNFLALARGDRLEARTTNIEQMQGDLARQMRLSQQMIDVIEGQIDALRAITTQERNAERAELERRLREEQEALRRLQDLIKQREAARKPPA
jgi:hypothetical protein